MGRFGPPSHRADRVNVMLSSEAPLNNILKCTNMINVYGWLNVLVSSKVTINKYSNMSTNISG